MSLQAFHANLKALLLADAGLMAWATAHFAKALTAINGNVPIAKIKPSELPALIFELGDGKNDTDGAMQHTEADIQFAFVWHEGDSAAAFAQRLELTDLVIKAVAADERLNGAVHFAWVSAWESDRNVLHPSHVMRFTVHGKYDSV